MENPLQAFRNTVFGPHIKAPWAIRLRDTLRFIETHTEYQLQVGIIPAGQNAFFVNSSVSAKFFGLKSRNSLNRNFQEHGFVLDHSSNVTQELRTLCPELVPSSHCWGKRRFIFGEFNGDISATQAAQAAQASNTAKQIRKGNLQMPTVPIASQALSPEKKADMAGMTSELGGWTAPADLMTKIDQTEGIWFALENQDWPDSLD
jgi:hypothetical protein